MLPPTSFLKSTGLIGGGVLGHALGGVLDAPRQALTNLAINPLAHSAVAAANDQPDDYSWASMLPGAAGLVAGGAAATVPGLQPFAPLIGAGFAGLAQGVGSYFDPKTFHAPSTGELVKTLGMDPDSGAGQAAGVGLGLATDPLTYAGGFEGMLGGGAVGGARDALATRAAAMGELAERTEGLQGLKGLADNAVEKFEGAGKGPFAGLERDLAAGPSSEYRPEVMDALNGIDPLAPIKDKAYRQVDPGMAQDLDMLGLGTGFNGKGVNLSTGQLPSWAESRGGWLKPTRAREAMLAGEEGQLAHPSLLGPNLDRAAGYEAVLQNPMKDLERLRGGAEGLGDLREAARKVPRFSEALGSEAGNALYDNPLARIEDFPVQPMMSSDPVRYVQGNMGGLPLYDARDRIHSMLADALQRHESVAAMPVTRLQSILQKLRLAPR